MTKHLTREARLVAIHREAWRDSWRHERTKPSDGASHQVWRGPLDERAFWCLQSRQHAEEERDRQDFSREVLHVGWAWRHRTGLAVHALRRRGWSMESIKTALGGSGLDKLVSIAAAVIRQERTGGSE